MAVSRRSYVFRLASDPVCYLWTGIGDLVTPSDDVDASGATWQGLGDIITIPALKALINGNAERATFTLSGVSAEAVRLAREDRLTVDGAELRLGYVEFDDEWQLDGDISWCWHGVADVVIIEHRNGQRTIGISAASADVFRANPQFTYWTHASQKLRSPDDLFCNQVAKISQGVTRRWGPK